MSPEGTRSPPVHGDGPGENVVVEAGCGQAVANAARLADGSLGQRVEAAFQSGYAAGSRKAGVGHGDGGGRLRIDASLRRLRPATAPVPRKTTQSDSCAVCAACFSFPDLTRYQEERVGKTLSTGGEEGVNQRLAHPFELRASEPVTNLSHVDVETMVHGLAFG